MATSNKGKTERNIVARATVRQVRISPQKMRLIIDLIRGMQVEPALQVLEFSPKKGAAVAHKLLLSAVANAKERANADVDRLWIASGYVDAGVTMKRIMARAHGRADTRLHRASHMTIALEQRS